MEQFIHFGGLKETQEATPVAEHPVYSLDFEDFVARRFGGVLVEVIIVGAFLKVPHKMR